MTKKFANLNERFFVMKKTSIYTDNNDELEVSEIVYKVFEMDN